MNKRLLACAASLACAAAVAQERAAPPASGTPEPHVQRTVVEGESVRIDELRVRGQLQSVVVTPTRSGLKPYEVLPLAGGRDPSQGPIGADGVAGRRVWQLLRF